jgi:hypothetical protein
MKMTTFLDIVPTQRYILEGCIFILATVRTWNLTLNNIFLWAGFSQLLIYNQNTEIIET